MTSSGSVGSGINSQIYQFIKDQGINKADTDGNGVIDNGEMLNFLHNEGKFSYDAIDAFWKSIDTNKTGASRNCLDANELEKVSINVVAYEEAGSIIEEFCKNAKSLKNNLKTKMNTNVDSILKNIVNGIDKYDESAIKTKVRAALTQQTLMELAKKSIADLVKEDEVASQLKKYKTELDGYQSEEDTDLQAVIEGAINGVSTEGSDVNALIEAVKQAVENAVKAYLSTAGLQTGVNADSISEFYSQDPDSELNAAQKTVLKNKLLESKKAEIEAFDSDFREQYRDLLKDYIDGSIDSVEFQDFEKYMKNPALFFENFDTKDLTNKVTIKKLFSGDENDENFKSLLTKLEPKLGSNYEFFKANLKDMLNDDNIKNIYNKFINDFTSYIKEDGSLDMEKLLTDVADEIAKVINTKLSGSSTSEDASLEDLQKIHGPFITGTDLDQARAEFIKFVDAFYLRGDEYKNEIDKYFGGVYKTKINSMYLNGTGTVKSLKEWYEGLIKVLEPLEKARLDKKSKDASNETIKEGAEALAGTVTDSETYSKLRTGIVSGQGEIHPEFGMNNGNIVFEKREVSELYERLKTQVKQTLESKAGGKEALQKLFGKENYDNDFNMLIQAAWIMAYNDYPSAELVSATTFVGTVLNNIDKILIALKTNPGYIEVYTKRTSYADTSVTENNSHYNSMNSTVGNDNILNYSGGVVEDTDNTKGGGRYGLCTLANSTDAKDYTVAMEDLYISLCKKYPSIDADKLKEIFKEAQIESMKIAQGNVSDCPFGTGNNGQFWNFREGYSIDIADPTINTGDIWHRNMFELGGNSRKDDDNDITVQELVQLTLYCFDKLLYKKLAA